MALFQNPRFHNPPFKVWRDPETQMWIATWTDQPRGPEGQYRKGMDDDIFDGEFGMGSTSEWALKDLFHLEDWCWPSLPQIPPLWTGEIITQLRGVDGATKEELHADLREGFPGALYGWYHALYDAQEAARYYFMGYKGVIQIRMYVPKVEHLMKQFDHKHNYVLVAECPIPTDPPPLPYYSEHPKTELLF